MNSSLKTAAVAAFGLVLCLGCGVDEGPTEPGELFDELERSMLDDRGYGFTYEIRSEGLVEADLEGRLTQVGEKVRLQGAGSFMGQPFDGLLVSDGKTLRASVGGEVGETPVPQDLRESVALGVTRMGLLHNLARLTGGAFPDHADGGTRQWLVVDEVEWAESERVLTFVIYVEGKRAGTAELSLDIDGRPRRRAQVVEFPEGEMRVVEIYSGFEMPAESDPDRFSPVEP